MKSLNLSPETSLEHNDQSFVESSNISAEPPVSDNTAAKRELAGELIAQGITEEAVCRILHISAAELQED